jgi:hypothetical protein
MFITFFLRIIFMAMSTHLLVVIVLTVVLLGCVIEASTR